MKWQSIYKKKWQAQDLAAQESMGAIVDRTPGTDPSTYRNVRSADVMLPKDIRWQDMADQQTARW